MKGTITPFQFQLYADFEQNGLYMQIWMTIVCYLLISYLQALEEIIKINWNKAALHKQTVFSHSLTDACGLESC